jgi:uncharacterized protein YecE (DUF72 family)
MSASIFIGTSGWHYDHWKGPFYPQDIQSDDMLAFYVQHFQTVEINNTFYQLPNKETFDDWRESTPNEFRFAVKASRYITHMKKLKDPHQPVADFMERAKHLEEKLGPILFQLPPNWHVNVERLEQFLQVLPEGLRYTFEFRDPSWFEARVYKLLEARGVAFCMYHLNQRDSPRPVTADFIYVRLHGPDGSYQGSYDVQTLSGWAGAFSTWAQQGKDVYCYFNNDQGGYAVKNARQLKEMLE